ncbi:cupin domain-containing protein [Streptomyces spinoverrucosus]|uniref:cupin domain-containing protein n=1 Tax=Streptomyces spinoverrucosus TaxID=284043 RepID=UPI0027D9ED46|nr:cupin domain-containing protein [Streptomyces spinoverrucosus]
MGQTLYIIEGVALVQSRGGHTIEARPGDVIHTSPGEEHWHGAAPDRFMTHLALWETDDTTWPDHVTDAEYHGPRVTGRSRA